MRYARRRQACSNGSGSPEQPTECELHNRTQPGSAGRGRKRPSPSPWQDLSRAAAAAAPAFRTCGGQLAQALLAAVAAIDAACKQKRWQHVLTHAACMGRAHGKQQLATASLCSRTGMLCTPSPLFNTTMQTGRLYLRRDPGIGSKWAGKAAHLSAVCWALRPACAMPAAQAEQCACAPGNRAATRNHSAQTQCTKPFTCTSSRTPCR